VRLIFQITPVPGIWRSGPWSGPSALQAGKFVLGVPSRLVGWQNLDFGIALAKVAHSPVIHPVEGAVRSELAIHGAIDPANPGDKRLLKRAVAGEAGEFELEGLAGPTKVDELEVVPLLRCAVRFREPEVALAGHQRPTLLDRAVDKGIRNEVESDGSDVSRLKG